MQHTSLYDQHIAAGAKMVDFAGWEMPIHYGSQVQEHHQVRTDAGMFDVSHMVVVDITGEQAKPFLQTLLANDIGKLTVSGKALYSCMLNETGGVIDDLITYFLTDTHYRIVVNAATREKDLAWMTKQAESFGVAVTERPGLAMIAVQGPNAREKAASILSAEQAEAVLALKPFFAADLGEWFVARTGYTGEDGFEMMIPEAQAGEAWDKLLAAGVMPIGLGARDTLRLEAGMNLYGTDMDEETSPLAAGLGWTIAWQPEERDFIGRKALEEQKAEGVAQKFVGLVLEGRGVLRGGMKVICDAGEGETTSGTFSPTLSKAVALARVPKACGDTCEIEVRNKRVQARVVKPSFVRQGKSLLDA